MTDQFGAVGGGQRAERVRHHGGEVGRAALQMPPVRPVSGHHGQVRHAVPVAERRQHPDAVVLLPQRVGGLVRGLDQHRAHRGPVARGERDRSGPVALEQRRRDRQLDRGRRPGGERGVTGLPRRAGDPVPYLDAERAGLPADVVGERGSQRRPGGGGRGGRRTRRRRRDRCRRRRGRRIGCARGGLRFRGLAGRSARLAGLPAAPGDRCGAQREHHGEHRRPSIAVSNIHDALHRSAIGEVAGDRVHRVTATILDGKATAAAIREDLRLRVKALAERGILPGLGTVLVGDDPASRTYVAGKHRDCAEIGVASIQRELPADATQDAVEAVVDELNADPACTGYLVQLPLPRQTRRAARAGADAPGQGRRRAAPGEPRPAGAPEARRPAVHAARHRRVAAPFRRADGRGRGRGGRARDHRRPPARPAARPARGERHRHVLPHRHPRPGRAHPPGRHRGDGGRRARPARRPTWCARARPCWTWGRPAWWARTARPAWSATSHPDVREVAGYLAPIPGGVGPMTRAMLLTNVVEAAESAQGV